MTKKPESKEQQMMRALVSHTKVRICGYQAEIAKLKAQVAELKYDLNTARVAIQDAEHRAYDLKMRFNVMYGSVGPACNAAAPAYTGQGSGTAVATGGFDRPDYVEDT
jgi:outer membrane murein-binding lipoprotein Lpp